MKKAYVTPTAEKLEFQYEKVVVASNRNCSNTWTNLDNPNCMDFQNVKNFS